MLIGSSVAARRGHLLMRGWSHSPPVRKVGDVLCFLVWCWVGGAPGVVVFGFVEGFDRDVGREIGLRKGGKRSRNDLWTVSGGL